MVFPSSRNIPEKKQLFAVIGSIIAITTILATSAAATQLSFAVGGCRGCNLSAFGSGSLVCGDNTTYPSTISIDATKGKGGAASGTLTISTTDGSGLTATGTITGGKISASKYSLQGTWDSCCICGASCSTASFTVSGPTGTSIPINFQSSAIASSSFTGTAQTTTPG
jgi:hypothetical protein